MVKILILNFGLFSIPGGFPSPRLICALCIMHNAYAYGQRTLRQYAGKFWKATSALKEGSKGAEAWKSWIRHQFRVTKSYYSFTLKWQKTDEKCIEFAKCVNIFGFIIFIQIGWYLMSSSKIPNFSYL